MQKPELLAPAGSFLALRAAVAAGADAVYLGGVKYSAREGAENFTLESIAEAVLLAHRSKVKVYVTVNTLQKDEEIEGALEFLRSVYNLGVDAAIVQDLGLADLARQHLPRLPLHASTQMTATSLLGVQALRKRGFARVVLARELTKFQIKEIIAAEILPCEIFVHGALCMAYSGQCLFSSLVGARSGNRGQCAQPCRLPYTSKSAPWTYPLSPKDLSLVDCLGEVLALGCASLKIEGRLKRPEYVAEVVGIYRRSIDKLAQGGAYDLADTEKLRLAQAFNRGFSPGYFHGRPQDGLNSGDSSGHRGITVGKVVAVGGQEVMAEFHLAVQAGDVLVVGRGEPFTLAAGYPPNKEVNLGLKGQARSGEGIARLVHAARNKELMDAVGKFVLPSPRLDWRVEGKVGEPLAVEGTCLAQTVATHSTELLERATGGIVPHDLLRRQLSKLGGTPFTMGELESEVEGHAFLPLSEINGCRRRVVEAMSQRLFGNPVGALPKVGLLTEQKKHRPQPVLLVSVGNAGEAEAAEASGAGALIFGREWVTGNLLEHLQLYQDTKKRTALPLCLRLPRILHSDEEKEWQSAIAPDDECYVSSLGGVEVVTLAGGQLRGDVGLNVANSYTALALRGLLSVTASSELSQAELRKLARHTAVEVEAVVHSRQLLMVIEQSLGGGELVDRKGLVFSLAKDYRGRTYVENPHVLSHLDSLYPLLGMPISRLRVDIAGVGMKLIAETVRLYAVALEMKEDPERLKVLRSNLMEHWGLLTRGHWQRGV
ncbi:MAG: putative protease YdcP [Firmicutes bacterium]|nr:putative protease YdcP [Bacillota bacterium]